MIFAAGRNVDMIFAAGRNVDMIFAAGRNVDMIFVIGRNGGWWEFDGRTAEQIEAKFNDSSCDGPKTLELMIAGLIFIIDLDAMVNL